MVAEMSEERLGSFAAESVMTCWKVMLVGGKEESILKNSKVSES